ncbi:MAG: HD domain-containing protein [Patescibacteria group bacterium]
MINATEGAFSGYPGQVSLARFRRKASAEIPPSPLADLQNSTSVLFCVYMDIVQEIKNFVEAECRKPSSKYGYEPFIFHFIPVVQYVERLADELGADKEVLLLAAWLHDIGSIIYGREDHHITGAKIAENKLKELNYPSEKIELVKLCILNHRGSKNNIRGSLEEQILAEADVLSNFDNIAGIFKAAFIYENKSQGEAKDSVRQKLTNKYNQLQFENSKKLIKPKYEAAMIMLS